MMNTLTFPFPVAIDLLNTPSASDADSDASDAQTALLLRRGAE